MSVSVPTISKFIFRPHFGFFRDSPGKIGPRSEPKVRGSRDVAELCLHCGEWKPHRRNLCKRCYYQPGIRDRYGRLRGETEAEAPGPLSAGLGGSEAKIEDLARRVQLRQQLFAEGDGPLPLASRDLMAGMTFGRRIAWLRYQRRWSQQFLARKAGLTQPLIHYLESERCRPRLATALALARALCEPLERLLGNGSTVSDRP